MTLQQAKANTTGKVENCLPEEITLELYNIDHSNLEGKLFKYNLAYLALTILQIYILTYEYLKYTQFHPTQRKSVSIYSLGAHSVWNFISMIIHLVFGVRIFTNYRKLIWLPVSALTVCHFSIQRKFLL